METNEKYSELRELVREMEDIKATLDVERSVARTMTINVMKDLRLVEFALTKREEELVESGAETFQGIFGDRGTDVTVAGDTIFDTNIHGNIERLEYDDDSEDVFLTISITDNDNYGERKKVNFNKVHNPENVLKFIVSEMKEM